MLGLGMRKGVVESNPLNYAIKQSLKLLTFFQPVSGTLQKHWQHNQRQQLPFSTRSFRVRSKAFRFASCVSAVDLW
jgi:hypothetical protein